MSVATFSRRVIARYGPPAGVPYNASASFRSKTVWGCGRLLYGELGTIEEGLEQRLVRYRHIRTCVYPRLHSQAAGLEAVWGRHGLGLSNARTGLFYFYALVTQLIFSDLRSTVICVEVTITSVFACLVDSEAKKASCTLHHAHITVH